MSMTCKICRHEKADEINQALIQNEPLRSIAGQYNVNRSSLSRHKKDHIPAQLAQATQQEAVQAGDLLQEVAELQRKTYTILERAEEAGDLRTALYAVNQARGNMELLCKMIAYLREQQLDDLSRKKKNDREEVSPLADDMVFMTALQRAIDETQAHYEETGQLPGYGKAAEIRIN